MRLNTLKPAAGAHRKAVRVGRGIGSGKGKTCGRGHKGQHARNTVPIGFEGGQMPLHRRLPKFGFVSWSKKYSTEIRLRDLNKIDAEVIDLSVLKATKLINRNTKFVKIIATGEITRPVTIKGLKVTKGARKLIEAAKGKVEE